MSARSAPKHPRSNKDRERGEAAATPSPPGSTAMPPREGRRIYVLAATALFLFYLALLAGHQMSIDGMLMQRQAQSIVVDGSLGFRSPVWTWDGNSFSNSQYGIGLSLLYVPGYLIASPLASLVPQSATRPADLSRYYYQQAYADPLYAVGGSWVCALLTALAAYLAARLALELGASRRAALWAMAFHGLGSVAIVYARGDFSQPLAGLCWVAGLLTAVRYRHSRRASWLWATAGVVAYGILSRPFEGLLLVPAVLAAILPWKPAEWDRRALASCAVVGAGVLAAVAVTLLVNFGRYGEMLHFGYSERARWMVPELTTIAAVFVSPARGILWQFPALVLVPFGALALVRRGDARSAAAILVLAGAMLVATACWHVWWGGWCWGLRLFVPAIAPLAVLAALGVDSLSSRARRHLPALLVAAGFAWSLPGLLTDSLAGYAKMADGPAAAWKLAALPPIGAWGYLRRWTAGGALDIYGIDIVWFRIAYRTDGWSLAVPVALVAVAIATALWCRRALLAAGERS